MIVFWRLFLALFLTDFVFFNKKVYQLQQTSRLGAFAIRSVTFFVLATAFCWKYLFWQWPFLEEVLLPGWLCISLVALFYGFTDYYFQLGGKIKGGYTLSFFLKNNRFSSHRQTLFCRVPKISRNGKGVPIIKINMYLC